MFACKAGQTMTSSKPVYIYLQHPYSGAWLTVGRYIWLPETQSGEFLYAPLYCERDDAISIDPINLPLIPGQLFTTTRYKGLHDALRDCTPDAWGKQLISRQHGLSMNSHDREFLMFAGNSDRWGALALGQSKKPAAAALQTPKLSQIDQLIDELHTIAEHQPSKHPQLRKKLFATPSLGGARPKATVQDGLRYWLAKPNQNTDTCNIARLEFFALALGEACGLSVPAIQLYGHGQQTDTLLIERFDRSGPQRHLVLSGASLLETEYPPVKTGETNRWSYPRLAEQMRRCGCPKEDTVQLFKRMIFNAIIGNDDDHPRNHAIVFRANEKRWRLSPMFDVVPNPDEAPKRLSMQLCAGHFEISRSNLLADAEKFGLAATLAEETLDNFTQSVGATAHKHIHVLERIQADAMTARIQSQLALLAE